MKLKVLAALALAGLMLILSSYGVSPKEAAHVPIPVSVSMSPQ